MWPILIYGVWGWNKECETNDFDLVTGGGDGELLIL